MDLRLHRSLLLNTTTAAAAATPSSSPPPPPCKPFRPSVALLAGSVATVFSLIFLLLLYHKHCRRRSPPPSSYHIPAAPFSSQRHSGLHRSVVSSLPLFRFSSLLSHHPPKLHHHLDCSVCLSPFIAADLLRLLPRCRHAFHVECIDTWLDSHSSCPLCRSRVHPDDLLLLPLPSTRPSRASAAEDQTRRSLDDRPPPRRKDGMLPTTDGHAEPTGKRLSHCIVVSGDLGTVIRDRWSDLHPSDVLFLRSEMILTPDGGLSARIPPAAAERCESDITGVTRRVGGGRREEEQIALRRWLSSAASLWLGRRQPQGG